MRDIYFEPATEIIVDNNSPSRKISEDIKYATSGSAGIDIRSNEDIKLDANKPTLVHTGIRVHIPSGSVLQICSRSGLTLKDGIFVLNAPGIVDSDYEGELCVILYYDGSYNDKANFEVKEDTNYIYKGLRFINYHYKYKYIPAGTRIAQAVLMPYIKANIYESDCDDISSKDNADLHEKRGSGGFGSTGI